MSVAFLIRNEKSELLLPAYILAPKLCPVVLFATISNAKVFAETVLIVNFEPGVVVPIPTFPP